MVSHADMPSIVALAWRMRDAIDSVPRRELPSCMAKFPRGACLDASLLLGAYFADNNVRGFERVSGSRGDVAGGNEETHAWLARQELIVDITADQFADACDGVIVSTSSIWHSRFVRDDCGPADFRETLTSGTDYLKDLYERLRDRLNSVPLLPNNSPDRHA